MRIAPFSFLKKLLGQGVDLPVPSFATGVDGSLTVLSGQTVDIPNGSIRQYTTVDVQAGGTLRILGGTALTQIVCQDTLNVDGQILQQGIENNGSSINTTTISGESFVASISQVAGGNGGDSGFTTSTWDGTLIPRGIGGTSSSGYGAGGSSGSAGHAHGQTVNNAPEFLGQQGAAGGSGNSNGASGLRIRNTSSGWLRESNNNAGLGNNTNADGTTPQAGFGSIFVGNSRPRGGAGGGAGGGGGHFVSDTQGKFSIFGLTGGGGGGGNKGTHGGYLYIFATNGVTGSGLIINSGQNGFNGANGAGINNSGNVADNRVACGGGGGGGAGGSGGHIIVEAPSISASNNINGGTGGTGGAGGVHFNFSNPPSAGREGLPGQNGNNGNAGSYTFIEYTGIPSFATGVDGDLTILNGETVNITAGSTLQYDNLDIQAGGKLQVTGTSSALTQIICRSSCNVEGEIVSRNVESAGYSISGTTVSGLAYSHTATQRSGGAGGRGAEFGLGPDGRCAGGSGGSQSQGRGGGGGGGGGGVNASSGYRINKNSGNGGNAGSSGQSVDISTNTWIGGGSGSVPTQVSIAGSVTSAFANGSNGSIYIRDDQSPYDYTRVTGGNGAGGGGAGGNVFGTNKVNESSSFSGGGGGGYRGRHGGAVYIFFNQTITGSGIVDVSGDSGFTGGNGGGNGDAANSLNSFNFGAGGGGGGAGGSGGLAIVESGGDSLTLNVAGGSGGSGGSPTTPQSGSTVTALSGGSGQSGLSGTSTKVAY